MYRRFVDDGKPVPHDSVVQSLYATTVGSKTVSKEASIDDVVLSPPMGNDRGVREIQVRAKSKFFLQLVA